MDRMDLVNHSYAALPCKIKEGFQTLAEKFRDGGIFTEADGTATGVLEDKAGWPMNNITPAKPAAPAVRSIVHRKKTVGKVTANPFCSIVERRGLTGTFSPPTATSKLPWAM